MYTLHMSKLVRVLEVWNLLSTNLEAMVLISVNYDTYQCKVWNTRRWLDLDSADMTQDNWNDTRYCLFDETKWLINNHYCRFEY